MNILFIGLGYEVYIAHESIIGLYNKELNVSWDYCLEEQHGVIYE